MSHPLLSAFDVATLGLAKVPRVRNLLRRSLGVGLRGLLRLRSRSYPVDRDPVALVFAPHQDDETLGCGGLLILKRLEGLTVRVAYITDGSGSHPQHPRLTPAALAALRHEEACQAMRLLGVEQAGLRFLGVRDGTLAHLSALEAQELVDKIAAVLLEVVPDEVFLPLRSDGSSEHDAAFVFVQQAIERAGLRPRVFEFPVWASWNPLRLLRPLCTRRRVWRVNHRGYEALKRQALDAYVSQTKPAPPWPEPVLSAEFLSFFSSCCEFFFEA